MKKVTTQIKKNNKDHTIFILVNDKMADFLNGLDEKTRHDYIVSEHQIYLNDLKETRRHQSLNLSLDSGFEFIDPNQDIEEKLENDKLKNQLSKALTTLTEKQLKVFLMYAEQGLSFSNIGKKMGISKDTAKEHYWAAIKKLKKILS